MVYQYIILFPNGETFNNKFLPVLDGLTHASLKMGITGYEVDPKTILGHANEEIEEYVTAGQYKHFIKRLHDNSINPKNDVVVILMADLNPYFLPDKYEKISSTFKAAVKVNELKDRIDKRKPKIYFGTYQGNF
uniref:Sulfotransferase domain-containing protein n=1 Tax=Strongyloides stercoralis TaxID=6248 RepID=A0A0K0E2U2_STRER